MVSYQSVAFGFYIYGFVGGISKLPPLKAVSFSSTVKQKLYVTYFLQPARFRSSWLKTLVRRVNFSIGGDGIP